MNWAAAALALGVTTSVAVAGEPRVLSDRELATITAAGVLVDVSSIAAALGDLGIAGTDANTFVFGGEHWDVGIGTTIGQALACCGEQADVEVGSAALGIGDYVRGTTRLVGRDGDERGRWAHGISLGFVLALSFGKHFAVDPDERLAMLEEMRTALADFRIELPDAARGAALSREALADMVGAQ